MGIHQEQREYLSMTGFGGIRETEGGDAVMHHVWEAEEAGFAREDSAKVLNGRIAVLESVDLLDCLVLVVRVGEVATIFDLLPEGEV